MSTTTTDTCPIEVAGHGGFHWHKCGKPIKRNGLCGIHAAAKEKRERDDAARLAAARERRRLHEAKAERQAALIAAEAAVQRVWALLDGAPMVPQAEVRRVLDGTAPTHATTADTDERGGRADGRA